MVTCHDSNKTKMDTKKNTNTHCHLSNISPFAPRTLSHDTAPGRTPGLLSRCAWGTCEVWGPRSGRVRHRSHRIESTTIAIDLPVRKRTPAYEYAHFREVRRSVVSESGSANGCLALASHLGSAGGARLTAGLTEDDDRIGGCDAAIGCCMR